MVRLIYTFLTLSLVLMLAACAPEIEPEESCNFVQNSFGQRVSWAQRPVSVAIEDTFPTEYIESLKAALLTWEEVTNGRLRFTDNIRVVSRADARSANIALLWEESWSSNGNEQAKTSLSFQSTNVLSAMIFFNHEDHEFSVNKEPGKVHMESLMIHELGHALGLDHIDEPTSVMYPRLATNKERTQVDDTVINSMACEY